MDADDSKYWGLFENRPAKERTSPAAGEPPHKHARRHGIAGDRWQRLRRTDTVPERVKC